MCRESATGTAPGRSKKQAAALAAAVAAALSGCAGVQSALDPAGPQAGALAQATALMVAGATAILALVMALAWYAVYRDPEKRRRVSSRVLIVGGGILFPIVVLSALLVYGVSLTGALRAADDGALQVHVTAHMWWWEVRYPGADGGEAIATANEIHIPAGRPVTFSLSSPDVIHSFWVPSLAGKLDVIPGHVTRFTVSAERPGRYRGQCAEFCGAQHALMAFHVVSLAPADFERWLESQRQPARPPAGARAARGRDAFLAQSCGNCHTVRGVVDSRLPGPDLTHLASRGWIGAGTLANTPGNLVRWLAEGELVKPGRAMPSYAHLDEATLAAIAEYLSGLE